MRSLVLTLVVAAGVAHAAPPVKVTPQVACESKHGLWFNGHCYVYNRPSARQRTAEERIADLEFRVQELENKAAGL